MKLVGRGTGAGGAYVPGDCYNAAPLCNNTTKFLTGNNAPNSSVCTSNDNYTWVCTTGSPPGNHTNKFRATFVDSDPTHSGSGTFTITLASGCTFDSTKTSYTAVGNYDWTGSGGNCEAITTTNGANSVVIPKSDANTPTPRVLDYMYFEFVCT